MLTESKIEKAYVSLCAIRQESPEASVSLARIGSHEIRMLAAPEVDPDGAPLFWLELFDHSTKHLPTAALAAGSKTLCL
jgi:hypothetical protein